MANEENNFENDISRMLGSMKQVDAPGDFDVRVRARIAQGRPSAGLSWISATASVAAMLLVIATAGYLGFRSFYSPVPTVEQAASARLTQEEIAKRGMPTAAQPTSNEGPVGDVDDQGMDKIVTPTNKDQASDSIASKPREMQPSIPNGLADTPRKRDRQPGGGNPEPASRIPDVITAPASTRHLSKEILSTFGIEANNSGSGWTVGEVKQNSRAQRSGLRTGDVIETLSNNRVRVRRGGKAVQLTLAP
jgi:hypothetical protein